MSQWQMRQASVIVTMWADTSSADFLVRDLRDIVGRTPWNGAVDSLSTGGMCDPRVLRADSTDSAKIEMQFRVGYPVKDVPVAKVRRDFEAHALALALALRPRLPASYTVEIAFPIAAGV